MTGPLFEEYLCDGCDVMGTATPDGVPEGWTREGRGILCTRQGGRRVAEVVTFDFCPKCAPMQPHERRKRMGEQQGATR